MTIARQSSESSVLVVGSVNVDLTIAVERLPAPGETVQGTRVESCGGGKGANAAVAAARLGAPTALVAAIGDDDPGREQIAELLAEGIDTASIAIFEGDRTGAALITVDRVGENQITVGAGANARLSEAHVANAFQARRGEIGVVLVSLEAPDEAVVCAVRLAHEHGIPCIVNPAPARDIAMRLSEWSPWLTPNAIEASRLTGASEPVEAAIRLADHSRGAIITLGAEGAVVAESAVRSPVHIPAHPADARDTTGAGDAFNGALAAQFAAGDNALTATRFAVVAAACAVRSSGARRGMPDAELVRAELRGYNTKVGS